MPAESVAAPRIMLPWLRQENFCAMSLSSESLLPDAVAEYCKTQGQSTAFIEAAGGDDERRSVSWLELDRSVRALAARLQREGLQGQPVLLALPNSVDYAIAVFACLYAGVIAVPAYPPRRNRYAQRLRSMIEDAGIRFALGERRIAAATGNDSPSDDPIGELRWIAVDSVDPSDASAWVRPEIGRDSVAVLQYTSGSTGRPRGVMVTHGNIAANVRAIRDVCQLAPGDTVVSWLPLFHDMGLVGSLFLSGYCGMRAVILSPAGFIRDPSIWLNAISKYRAVCSVAPNFAYEYCASRIGPHETDGLDLSAWQFAFNGSEPVRASTLERFAAAFAACGFQPEAFRPSYGLAESTLYVTGIDRAASPRVFQLDREELKRGRFQIAQTNQSQAVVGCGKPSPETRVEIVDPATQQRSEPGQAGEIWLSGPSVALGYWSRPDETAKVFHARLAGDEENRFLRTGDLGCFFDGELVVTGRLKDLIVIRGANYYPQDIEASAALAHPDIPDGCAAAFAVEHDGEDRVFLVCEVSRSQARSGEENYSEMAEAIRRTVHQEHGITLQGISLVRPGSIPKTSSGKIRRAACREGYLGETLPEIYRSELGGGKPGWDSGLSRDTLLELSPDRRMEELFVSLRDNLARYTGFPADKVASCRLGQLGLDSLASAELAGRIQKDFGVRVPISNLMDGLSLPDLARFVVARVNVERVDAPISGNGHSNGHALPPSLHEDWAAPSEGQRALWFFYRVQPESPVYNLSLAVELDARLDVPALERSLRAFVSRHAVLRIPFRAGNEDSGPKNATWRNTRTSLEFPLVEAADWDRTKLLSELRRQARRPFALDKEPLFRCCLYRTRKGYVLALNAHHIILDWWSVRMLAAELSAIYRMEVLGESCALPDPVPYAEFVRWQRHLLDGPEGNRLLQYWRTPIEGADPVLRLPADHPRPAAPLFEGAAIRVSLPEDIVANLKSLAASESATLYQVFLAVYLILLHRRSGQEQFLVGTPVSGRTDSRFLRTIGYCVNSLPLRADLSQNPSFRELLDRVRRTSLSALDHQDLPFSRMVEAFVQGERDPSCHPLFQVMFAWLRDPAEGFLREAGGRLLPLDPETAKLDLTLEIQETAGCLEAVFEYDCALFERFTIARMVAEYCALLRAFAGDADLTVNAPPLLDAAEHSHVRRLGEGPSTPFAFDLPAHVLIERAAAERPGAVAVSTGSVRLTYGQLDQLSTALAIELMQQGAGPEERVALFMPGSAEAVVGLLGILKSGAAAVPIDPEQPSMRIATVLQDCGCRLAVTRRDRAAELAHLPVQPVLVDLEQPVPLQMPALPRGSRPAHPENVAYVIYTSGSTGQPKGVAVSHRALSNHIAAAIDCYRLVPSDRVLQFSSPGFDVALEEILPTLACGASLVPLAEEARQRPAKFWQLCRDHRITVLNLPTAWWRQLTAELEPGIVPYSIRLVVVGGEAPSVSSAERWRSLAPSGTELLNAYGLTETTITATAGALRGPAIGRPLNNMRVCVLDDHFHLQPPGVPGELYIGGECLARGYLDMPGRTAERFVPDPFAEDPGERLYRTGDLARMLPDGILEFLGRRDRQIKLRGHRIELDEIESLLRTHPDISDAAVCATTASDAHVDRLIAYVCPQAGSMAGSADLRIFLQQRLPDSMIPAAFAFVPEFPLTANGKVDRKALLSLNGWHEDTAVPFAPPRTEVESELAALWSEVLHTGEIGIHDSFFARGGHSLLASQLVVRIEKMYSIDLPLSAIFENATIAELAETIETLRWAQAAAAVPSEAAAAGSWERIEL